MNQESLEKNERRENIMSSEDVLELYFSLCDLGIQIWIDGGWCVDALLGKETRPHKDIDIVIQEKDLSNFRRFLEIQGYKDINLEEAKPWNFVLGDNKGHQIDVHVIVLDDKGNGIYGPAENGQMYPAESLTGSGIIGGQLLKCISPEWIIRFHSGYELKEKDFKDVSALWEKFNIDLPEEFKRFNRK